MKGKRPVDPKRVTVTGGSYHVTGIIPIPEGKTEEEFRKELNDFMDDPAKFLEDRAKNKEEV